MRSNQIIRFKLAASVGVRKYSDYRCIRSCRRRISGGSGARLECRGGALRCCCMRLRLLVVVWFPVRLLVLWLLVRLLVVWLLVRLLVVLLVLTGLSFFSFFCHDQFILTL